MAVKVRSMAKLIVRASAVLAWGRTERHLSFERSKTKNRQLDKKEFSGSRQPEERLEQRCTHRVGSMERLMNE